MTTPPTKTSNGYSGQPRDKRNDTTGTRRLKPEPWTFVRRRIWQRDSGTCQVCGKNLTGCHFVWGWTCGHLIDRDAGGNDEDDNLAVMCNDCDRIKPRHWSLHEYRTWRNGRNR